MVDFRVTVFDGSYHDVDSNELSFKLAGSLAFKDAMTRARPTILEPVMNVEVYAPSDYAGDLMGDLNGRRGRIGGMDTRGATTIIKAQVPMSEMLTYEQHLTSATGGRGSYHMEYSHYDEVPSHLQTKIIAAAKAERAGVERRGLIAPIEIRRIDLCASVIVPITAIRRAARLQLSLPVHDPVASTVELDRCNDR